MEGWQLLTDDERAYFSEFESMFNSKGWQHLIREMEAEQKDGPEQLFWEATDWEQIVLARVRFALLTELKNYERIIEHRKDAIIAERMQQIDELRAGVYADE